MQLAFRGSAPDPLRRRLVVISNRTATPGEARAGGLAVGIGGALHQSGGLWFGWSGRISGQPTGVRHVADGPVHLALTDLTADEHEGYYSAYANRALWPVLHYRLDLAEFDATAFRTYEAVNRRFARQLAPLLRPDDLVWVHDYHLMLMGRELRALGWQGTTGFFLHVPFPAPDFFAALPEHDRIGRAMAAFDLVGFQTEGDAANFRRYMMGTHGAAALNERLLELSGRRFRVGSFPIGIDPDEIDAMVQGPEARAAALRLRQCMAGQTIVLGADRLDYTKGLPHRLRAFERLLERDPDLHRRVTLLQIASPSRADLPAYRDVAAEVEGIAGRINGAFGSLDWTPVHHLARYHPRATLAGCYRAARVGLVTPLCDGMNLVAKEFVAAQDPADPGVLVLSRFAGAAARLDAALLVNPHDTDAVAAAIRQALDMPLDERRHRWQALNRVVRREDAEWWRQGFLDALHETRPAMPLTRRRGREDLAEAV